MNIRSATPSDAAAINTSYHLLNLVIAAIILMSL